MSGFPPCFETQAQYAAWKRVAIIAKEVCSPCSDCTKPFKHAMIEKNRCHPVEVRINFGLAPRFPSTLEEQS